jgi:hypothetical protein
MMVPLTQKSPALSEQPEFMENVKFFTTYAFEILKTLYDAERNNINIKKRSDQLEIRPALVDLLKEFAKQQDYKRSTLHLGKSKF